MSKPIGPGDKCILIKARVPQNWMKPVVVTRIMGPGDQSAIVPPPGHIFRPPQSEGFEVEIESLSSPFMLRIKGHEPISSMICYAKLDWLKRLDDDDDSASGSEDKILEKEAA